jgi:hypothetical protein
MSHIRLLLFLLIAFTSQYCKAQVDTTVQSIQDLPLKYINQIDSKIDKYSNRIITKTEKTLTKLSRWENKIHSLLLKVNPQAAQNLFGNNQTTFSSLLQKIEEGKSIAEKYQAKYDEYRDRLITGMTYLQKQKDSLKAKLINPINKVNQKLMKLDDNVKNSEALENFIRERKNRLIDESIKYIGKSKYLKKINKEAYYYVESIRNFKEIFSDKKRAEELAIKLLNEIPAFKKFVQQNSQLASLFSPAGFFPALPAGGSVPIVNGLATRASLQQFFLTNMPTVSGTSINPVQQIQNQLGDVGSPINKWKDKQNDIGGMKNNSLPDFTPNTQRTKSFRKRLETGTDFQFGKSVNFLPATSDIGLKLGYMINDKSSAGIGLNYKIGLGNGWDNIHFTNQGVGLRTYLKWKLKKGLDIQGGSEWNYMLQFKKIEQLKNYNAWQQSALLGLCKNYSISKKVKGNISILYDFLYSNHLPNTQPLVFRVGYGF